MSSERTRTVLELSPGGTSFLNADGSPLSQNTNEQNRDVSSERTRTVLELSPGGTTFTEGTESVKGTQSPLDACKFAGKEFPILDSESAMDGSSKKSMTKMLHKGHYPCVGRQLVFMLFPGEEVTMSDMILPHGKCLERMEGEQIDLDKNCRLERRRGVAKKMENLQWQQRKKVSYLMIVTMGRI